MEGSLKVSTRLDKEDVKKLAGVCYDNAKDTMKKDGKIDPVVFICGLFAVGCFIVSVYNVAKNGIDLTYGVLMACYVLVGVVCLVKPLQRALGKCLWSFSFAKRLGLNTEGMTASFDESAMSYSLKGQDKIVFYENMGNGVETDTHCVFFLSDNMIVPVSKAAVKEAAGAFDPPKTDKEISKFIELIISKANGTAPEEEIPNITR